MTAEITAGTLRLQPLTYVPEGDEVMVGRPDIGSYGVFPPEGAELLQALESGASLEEAARRWHHRTGETLDVTDFLEVLDDLSFLVPEGENPKVREQVRWQRLGRAVFSGPALLGYATVILLGLVAMVLDPGVRPNYSHIFFTSQLAVITVVLALAQFPLLLLHETFHALAARRLNLPSTLGIGRRFYYLVAETRITSLYSVPRSQRYLPFLAGALVDAVGVGVFTLLCVAGRHWGRRTGSAACAWRWPSAACCASSGSACSTWRPTSTSRSAPPVAAPICMLPPATGSGPGCGHSSAGRASPRTRTGPNPSSRQPAGTPR